MGRYRRYVEASEYEDFVKSVFDSLVEKEVGTVHLHKRLVGKRTGHEHDIDIVIEAAIANLQILILVECKNYKRSVEIGDVLANRCLASVKGGREVLACSPAQADPMALAG